MKAHRTIANVLALALVAGGATAQAQVEGGAPQEGSLVRVHRTGSSGWDAPARVERTAHDSLIVTRGDTTLVYATRDLTGIEVSVGTRRHVLKGLGIGFAGGALVGAAIGYSQGDDHCTDTTPRNPIGSEAFNLGPCYIRLSAAQYAAFGAALLGAAGGLGGAVAGALYTTPVWQSVSFDGRMAPIAGAGGKFGLSIAY